MQHGANGCPGRRRTQHAAQRPCAEARHRSNTVWWTSEGETQTESWATSRNNSLQAAPPWSEEKNAPRRSLVLSFWKARRTDLLSATAHLQVFGDLFNAMIDPETEKKKRTPAHMPGFAVAAANPDLAVKMVLRKEHAKKAAWWKAHARLSSPSGMPCDTLCEIIKNE